MSVHWIAAGLAALSVYLVMLPVTSADERVAKVRAAMAGDVLESPVETSQSPAARAGVCVLAGLAIWLFIGGAPGAVVAIAVMAAGPGMMSRLESRSDRLRRQALESAAPAVAELLSACLSAGASVQSSTAAVASAMGEPVESALGACVAKVRLGADPLTAWSDLLKEPSLAPIARAIGRSADSGAPLADLLLRVADDLRSQRRASLEALARTAGVKAVAPLGLCFLPAFMLIGVVPLVASLVMKSFS